MTLSPRFEEALAWAAELHRAQVRKGTGVPYVSHLLAVASLVLEHGGDEDQAIAALLHDAPEDQGGAPVLEEIRLRFGDRVADIVEACTDSLETDPERKAEWRMRKEAYIAALRKKSEHARLVSAADKLHNARTILLDYRKHADSLWSRFRGGRQTLWYYRALTEEFLERGPKAIADELERVVRELHLLADEPYPARQEALGHRRRGSRQIGDRAACEKGFLISSETSDPTAERAGAAPRLGGAGPSPARFLARAGLTTW